MNTQKTHKTALATILCSTSERLSIDLSGRLDIHTTSSIWNQCMAAHAACRPKLLLIDAGKLTYCDGAGIALLTELKSRQDKTSQIFEIKHLADPYQKLFKMIIKTEPPIQEPITDIKLSDRIKYHVGFLTISMMQQIKNNLAFSGKMWVEIVTLFLHPRTLRWKEVLMTVQQVGPHALPIIALLGMLIGIISAFQSDVTLAQFGAQSFIGGIVGITLVREMGPLITAIILAGRTASSFAAELGTMKINQEIDALTTMGLDSMNFLIIPRVIATTLTAPFLNVFLIFFGLVGCGMVLHSLGFSHQLYFKQVKDIVHIGDIVGSLVKSLIFGLFISAIGCLHGIKTRFGASAVGQSTTAAVVAAIIMIVVIDGVFAVLFHALGV